MKLIRYALVGLALSAAAPVAAQEYETVYVRLPGSSDALLYDPATDGPNSNIGIVFQHPNRDNFNSLVAAEMVKRGYHALMVNYRGDNDYARAEPDLYLTPVSHGINYLRGLPGIEHVILIGHSGGTHVSTLYQNVAENGPDACSGPEKVYPCVPGRVGNLNPADALILLDPTLGAGHNMSAIDPALRPDGTRDPALDMFAPENGYDPATGSASYSAEFLKTFYAAQGARNAELVEEALARLALIEAGEGEFSNDEPFIVRGVGVGAAGMRPYQPDLSLAAQSRAPHLLIKADGTTEETIITSVRPVSGGQVVGNYDELDLMNYITTVRRFLGDSGIRTTEGYAFTPNSIEGIDFASSFTSSPANARGVTVPALVVNMTCHYLIVVGELIYDNLASADKSYAAVEGAAHGMRSCRPEYGDTATRLFDHVDQWINARF